MKIKRIHTILTGHPATRKKKYIKKTKLGPAALGPAAAATLVSTFLHMLNTIKLYHWNTTHFATHKTTDELYGSLNEKIDEFVEVMLGKQELGGRAKLLTITPFPPSLLHVYSNNEAFTPSHI